MASDRLPSRKTPRRSSACNVTRLLQSSIASAGPRERLLGIRLLAEFDCAQEYPADAYFGHGNVTVVESPIGPYREAEGRPLSRFGYRFQIEHIGRPHLAVIRYPDDKRRFMCVMDGTCYDLTTGVYTDFENPLSGKMLEIRRLFWPRDRLQHRLHDMERRRTGGRC